MCVFPVVALLLGQRDADADPGEGAPDALGGTFVDDLAGQEQLAGLAADH